MAHIVTVASTAPLTVLEDGASTAIPAVMLGRGDGYSPGIGIRVVVERVGTQLYLIGGA